MNDVHNDTKLKLILACPWKNEEANTEDKCVLHGIHIVYIDMFYMCGGGDERNSHFLASSKWNLQDHGHWGFV